MAPRRDGTTSAYGGIVFDTVILAGGRAQRLGGVDKPGLEVGGVPMVAGVAAAARASSAGRGGAGGGQVVIVGPPRDIPGAVFVREEPPGAGPVPALRAGLAEVTASWVLLLAGDLPFLRPAHLTTLLARTGDPAFLPGHPAGPESNRDASGAVRTGTGDDLAVRTATGRARGVVAVDGEGREQWLLGVWDVARVREALDAYEGRSLRGLLEPLVDRRVPLPREAWFDCDTGDDLREARNAAGARSC
ncbi:NTP transferase domain-containing protein [Nonomuraea sp. MCN248]|uniref:NTP transferase domain-containing protein n=1 Tax=Nonomuraea corallina TaxID=2989783 RepID=A0ABT4SHR7_9ACTN|nr:NTP transferase domain-containing protein [Nonomuraea corallina]MDA0636758.1 NTP transferase domain-containing protein [Nonomuraea corallina]